MRGLKHECVQQISSVHVMVCIYVFLGDVPRSRDNNKRNLVSSYDTCTVRGMV